MKQIGLERLPARNQAPRSNIANERR